MKIEINRKVVLCRSKDRCYYKSQDKWVNKSGEAFDFESTIEAFNFCIKNNLKDVMICLVFDDPRYDVKLPVF